MSAARIDSLEAAGVAAVERIRRRSLMVAVIAGMASIVGAFLSPNHFFRSYLLAYMFWLGLTLGCLAVLMLQHLTGGAWALVIRRQLEAGSRLVPLMAALFTPLLLGMRHLYVWARPEERARDEHLRAMAAYLDPKWFIFRAVLYFLVWALLARVFNRWSELQDSSRDSSRDLYLRSRFTALSGPGLAMYVLTITFASVDWVMSLNPHWQSTIFALLFVAGQCLSALAFVIALSIRLAGYRPMSEAVRPDHRHDLGNLMLTFVMLWAYFAYSQWLIIWSGNLADEISWYLDRLRGGWEFLAVGLIFFHFAVPFALLLSRELKRHGQRLAWIALGIIFMRFVDLFWLIQPNFPDSKAHFRVSWLDLTVPLAMGGIWLAMFLRGLLSRPLLPLNDPQLQEVFARHVEAEH